MRRSGRPARSRRAAAARRTGRAGARSRREPARGPGSTCSRSGSRPGGPNALAEPHPGAAGDAAGADRDRAAHAADVHQDPRRAPATRPPRCTWSRPRTATRSRPAASGSRRVTSTWSSQRTAARVAAPHEPGPARELVPAVGRRRCSARWRRSTGSACSPSCSPAWATTGCAAPRTIRRRGGQVLAQDEATSVVWGMPGFVARAGPRRRGPSARRHGGGDPRAGWRRAAPR